jgi:hypothetical protein
MRIVLSDVGSAMVADRRSGTTAGTARICGTVAGVGYKREPTRWAVPSEKLRRGRRWEKGTTLQALSTVGDQDLLTANRALGWAWACSGTPTMVNCALHRARRG